MDTFLISGVSGYVGSRVAEHASRSGFRVVGLTRRIFESEEYEVITPEWSSLGLTRLMEDLEPAYVIHLASKYEWTHSIETLDSQIEANFALGLRLWASSQGVVDRFVTAGSYFENMRSVSSRYVNLYAALKDAFARTVLGTRNDDSPGFVEVQLNDIYGPRDPRPKLIPSLIESGIKGASTSIADLEATVRPLFIDDAVAALLHAATDHSLDSGRYGLSAESLTVGEVVEAVERCLGTKVAITHGVARRPMLPTDSPPTLPGWQPSWSIDEGLHRIIQEVR